MKILVDELSQKNDDEFTNFLDSIGHQSHSVLGYHYPFYRDMLVEIGVGHPVYLGARLNGNLVGFLPAFKRQSLVGEAYCSLPFFGPNAGVLCGNEQLSFDIHQALLMSLLDRAESTSALSCSIYTPLFFNDFRYYDTAIPNAICVNKFTQTIDLRNAKWDKDIRYDIRKAELKGLKITKEFSSKWFDEFYSIYEQNCQDRGIPLKPRMGVEALVHESLLGKHTNIYFALYEDQIIGGLLMVWSPLTASYYIPASLDSMKSLQPITLLIDVAAHEARERGIEIWNWESSPSRDSGVFQFKKKWGSLESSYRIYVKTFQPESVFQQFGKETLSTYFPYYYVYPFDRL